MNTDPEMCPCGLHEAVKLAQTTHGTDVYLCQHVERDKFYVYPAGSRFLREPLIVELPPKPAEGDYSPHPFEAFMRVIDGPLEPKARFTPTDPA